MPAETRYVVPSFVSLKESLINGSSVAEMPA
jgi:hypothetical protein